MNFYQFLEMRILNEMTNETDFIRKFFTNFQDFNNYDKQTLGVFADWLQEHDDPRSKLVRMAYEADNLLNASMRSNLAIKLGITNNGIIDSIRWVRGSISYVLFYITIGGLCFAMNREGKSYWLDAVYQGKKIENINQIQDNDLVSFFWPLIGYGWNYNGVGF
jgi:hypothetical protein